MNKKVNYNKEQTYPIEEALKFVKENRDAVLENIRNRHMDVDVDNILALYEKRSMLIRKTEELRQNRNVNARKMKGKLDADVRQTLIDEGKVLKNEVLKTDFLK